MDNDREKSGKFCVALTSEEVLQCSRASSAPIGGDHSVQVLLLRFIFALKGKDDKSKDCVVHFPGLDAPMWS